jgi:hypothetical protein
MITDKIPLSGIIVKTPVRRNMAFPPESCVFCRAVQMPGPI